MSPLVLASIAIAAQRDWVVYEGKGKSVVFLAGDEEYRSEEGLPQLAKLLSVRHGFKCTVLFSIGKTGEIDPKTVDNEPGLEALDSADLCVMLLRFRRWPDEQMSHFVRYYLAGKPIIALRTSTHAFDYPADSRSPFREFGWQSAGGGFGKRVLGENWVSHWGEHGAQGTRGVPAGRCPLLQGVDRVFVTTDVYEAAPPADAEILMRGQVVAGMTPDAAPAEGRKKTAKGVEQPLNDPMMPIAWLRQPKNEAGRTNKVMTCTMGAATDLLNEGLRRLIVNGVFWALDKPIPPRANVDLVGPYKPSAFGFDGFRKGVKPAGVG
jgi:hypothetical protein